MYAVIKSGGKQHRVKEGQVVRLEKIEAETGANIDFSEVLMVADGDNIQLGTPLVEGAVVSAEVVDHGRAKKVTILKFKRRKHHMKRQGHRQWYTEVKINGIALDGAKPTAKKAPAKAAAKKAPAKKAAKTEGDDLTKLSGVGPVIVGKLNDAGISTFKQIAEWTAEDVAKFDEELNFKGRIERENWIEQAKELVKGE
ncbi:50S ribosomal protein L21 [Kangiella koreensis]|uniref:Large ribosomal subunit protein bL21 n=1 Tax=Kangiella koreensis (strain DSM 16069 / JCM 12317 / KCTC 12182 / SW-125) TaxID=523791 RepID=C7RCU4_KANKD|nr:ribosomal protein L21 [Kangiella koreensis DSM 16069]